MKIELEIREPDDVVALHELLISLIDNTEEIDINEVQIRVICRLLDQIEQHQLRNP